MSINNKKWCNWDDLYRSNDISYTHTPTALWAAQTYAPNEGVDPLIGDAEPINKSGEIPRKPTDEEIAEFILRGTNSKGIRQATDEELFGHLVVTEEQMKKAEYKWDNKLDLFYKAAKEPINKSNQEYDWGSGKSFNDSLTEEERLKRNMYTGE